MYEVDGLILDTASYEIRIDGDSIEFTNKEFDILRKLVGHPGRVYSRERLVNEIWGDEFDGEPRTVDSHIARIRTKLGDWGNKHLITVYGTGYKVD